MKKYTFILILMTFSILPICLSAQSFTSGVGQKESSVMTKIQASGETKSSSSNWLSIVALVTGLVAVAAAAMAYLKLLSLEKNFDSFKEVNRKNGVAIKTDFDSISDCLAILNNTVKGLTISMQDFKLRATRVYSDTTDKPMEQCPDKKSENTYHVIDEPKQRTESNPKKTLYAGTPYNGGFTKTTSNYIPGQSLYVIDDNGQPVCQYNYIENADTAIIGARSLSRFVESGCIVQSPKNQFRKIKTIKPGTVRKTSTGWSIETKAIVELL